jgi:hypothetical protein
MSFIKLTDLDLAGKRVLIRSDLNVPVKDGKVTSDARITASMPTFEHCMKAGAKVMVMSHLGRPEGEYSEENSLQARGRGLSAKLGKPVRLIKDYLEGPGGRRRRAGAAGERALQQGREEGQRGAGQEVRRPVRRLRDGRLRHRPPRPGLHPRRASSPPWPAPVCCWPRSWTPCQGPGQPGPPHGRHRRRLQGLHQAHRARGPVREGRPARGGRRHRQHLPRPPATTSASPCASTTWCPPPRP